MRNLKRVLSLALASVMVLGMMVVGAGAADKKATDLTDMDKVANKEAVSLLVDLNIIAGKDDGTFSPAETVDRATMAKLVYKVLMGDASESAFKGAGALKDVSGHWAEGFINYCYSIGLIAGDGTGNFLPATKVSTVGAAKMMLVALGFDAADRGYINDSQWSINIMKDAQANGLLKGISQKATDELTRDNAALMIFNTLFANTRTPEYDRDMGEKYIKSYTVNAATLGMETYGLVKYNVTINNMTPSITVNSVSPKAETALTSADKSAVVKAITNKDTGIAITSDMVGTNVAVYAKAEYTLTSGQNPKIDTVKFTKLYSTTAGTADTTVLGTSTNGTPIDGYDGSAVKKDLTTKNSKNSTYIADLNRADNTDPATAISVISIWNGMVQGSTGPVDTAKVIAGAKKAGAVVELIDTGDDGIADIVKVTQKSVATLTADMTTRTSDGDLQVKVPGVTGLSAWTDAKNVKGYEDLKKGDVVLYYVTTVGSNTTYTIEKAAVVEGKPSASKGSGATIEYKIDGTFYAASGLTTTPLADVDTTNTFKFYLDNNGTVVKADKVTNETSGETAILVSTGWAGSSTELGATSYAQAKILRTDGTTEIVKLAKIDGTPIVFGNYNGTIASNLFNKFVTFTVNDDEQYELKTATATALAGTGISNGAKEFNGSGNGIGSADTLFIVAINEGTTTSPKIVYKTYTGISSIPTMRNITGQKIVDKNVATKVFVDASGSTSAIDGIDADSTFIYVPDYTDYVKYAKNGDVPAYWEYVAYVNGAKSTVQTSGALPTDNAIYKFSTKNDAGHYSATAAAHVVGNSTDFVTGIYTANGGTLQVTSASGTIYGYDDETMIYVINKDKELTQISASELAVDSTNKLWVVSTSGHADYIFIQEIVGATATAAISVSVNGAPAASVSTPGSAGVFTGVVTAANTETVKFTVAPTADATYTIQNGSFTMGTTAQTVIVTVTSEDGLAVSTYTITVNN